MDSEIIKLQVGESAELWIPGRGAVPIRLVTEVKPENLVEIERKEIPQGKIPESTKPGDPLPAYFLVTGTEAGKGILEFFEQPLGAPESSRKSLKKYQIEVSR